MLKPSGSVPPSERVDCVVIGHIAEQAALGLIEGSADLVEVIFLAVLIILR